MEQQQLKQHSLLNKFLGSINVLLTLIVLAVVGVGGYFGHKLYQAQLEGKETQDMMLANLRIMNEQTVVSELVREKLGDKLSTDQVAKVAFVLVDGCRKNDIPLPLAMGLIEQESSWNPKAISNMGAIGLMQCMPDTAIRHFKQRGLAFSIEALYDPVLNVSIGLDILLDKHETAIAQGKASKDDFIYALYYYCGKGDTYAREVVARAVPYKKRFDAPLQDMLRKAQERERLASLQLNTTADTNKKAKKG